MSVCRPSPRTLFGTPHFSPLSALLKIQGRSNRESLFGIETIASGNDIRAILRTVGNLACRAGWPSCSDEAFLEHFGESVLCLAPFVRRHFSFSGNLTLDEREQFHRRVIGWKMPSRSHGAAQLGVQGFDGACCADDPPHRLGKGEKRNDPAPSFVASLALLTEIFSSRAGVVRLEHLLPSLALCSRRKSRSLIPN